ncbi:4776_t:CDS:10, partial [Entrophospora sp. SA101]
QDTKKLKVNNLHNEFLSDLCVNDDVGIELVLFTKTPFQKIGYCQDRSQGVNQGPFTPTILDYLGSKGLKATFFVIGSRATNHPDVLLRASKEGHQIGIHTWSHTSLTTQTNEVIIAELKWTEKIIKEITGLTPKYMRPPRGDYDDRVRNIAKQLGYKSVIWDHDTFDWMSQQDPTYDLNWIPANFTQWVNEASTTGFLLDDKQAEDKEEEKIVALDEGDIALLKTYGQGPYAKELKKIDSDIKDVQKRINEKIGVKESDTGLAPPNLWDIPADKQRMQEEQPLQVARCTKIIEAGEGEEAKYIINVKQIAKFVVALGERVSPTDIEEGMRVGVDRNKYQIQIPLPPKIDPSVTMMQVEEKPDVTYSDVGGCKEQIEKLREVVELPLLQPERFVNLGIDPPKGVLLYGPPGTGKTLCARAVANRTDATFIRVIGSELVQKYVGEGARMVRELFEMARTKKACIIFFDEIDAIGGARYDDGAGGDNEVQRTMLELINQLDGFDPRGNIKILMATNRPDTLDPALLRPGRLDRKGRTHILKIHAKSMSVERDIRYELIARLCPNSTGAELRSVCTEAGMFAIRSRRKVASEKDFLESVNKVIKSYAKFSSTPR